MRPMDRTNPFHGQDGPRDAGRRAPYPHMCRRSREDTGHGQSDARPCTRQESIHPVGRPYIGQPWHLLAGAGMGITMKPYHNGTIFCKNPRA